MLRAIDRRGEGGGPELALDTAARWLVAHGPAVVEALARLDVARAGLAAAGAWPDPTLELGPQLGFGDEVSGQRWTPFASLSIEIPLGGRLGASAALARAEAEAARIEALCAVREQYLALRDDYLQLGVAAARRGQQAELVETAGRARQLAERAVEAGIATALDVAALELEQLRAEADQLESEEHRAAVAERLATRVGVPPSAVLDSAVDTPPLADAIPDPAVLRALWQRHSPALVRLRAAFAVAERTLRLEVERQYPDLVLGPSFSDEPGEDKQVVSLGFGVRLPLFARNRRGIAEARAAREALRTRYTAALAVGDAELAAARRALAAALQRARLFAERLAPRAEANVATARRAVEAGVGDARRLLEVERSARLVRLAQLETDAAVAAAWARLEHAVGAPLLDLGDGAVSPPPILATPVDAAVAEEVGVRANAHDPGTER